MRNVRAPFKRDFPMVIDAIRKGQAPFGAPFLSRKASECRLSAKSRQASSYSLTCLGSIPKLISFCAGERGVAQRTYSHHLAKREARVIALGDAMAGLFVLINLLRNFFEMKQRLRRRIQPLP